MATQPSLLASCKGVEIFASGIFRGKEYTVPDLEQIARNFAELGPLGRNLIQPPVVLGHEETQEFLDKTDLPAAAWPSRVWVEKYHDQNTGKTEAILKADFNEVPPIIARLINSRAYRKVSPEIYDDFQDDFGNSYGKALRRVALLGGEIPQVKRLADIPLARFSERRIATHRFLKLLGSRAEHPPVVLRLIGATHNAKRGTFSVFAEVAPMDRAALIQQVLAAMPNLQQAVLDTMTDEQLQAIASAATPAAPAPVPGEAAAMADVPRADMIADLVASGQDPAALEAMSDEELKALYDQMSGAVEAAPEFAEMSRDEMIAKLTADGKDPQTLSALSDEELKAMIGETPPAEVAPMAEVNPPSTNPGAIMPAKTAPVQPRPQPKKVTLQFAEKQAMDEVNRLRQEVASERFKLAKQRRENKRQDAELFCETLVRAGQIRPVDVPAYVSQLMNCDNERQAVKFSEAGREEIVSAFEFKKRELAKLPQVIKFGEKIQTKPATNDASETEKMRRIANHPVLADGFKSTGKKPEQLVHTFSERRKRNPELTAEQHARDLGLPAEIIG